MRKEEGRASITTLPPMADAVADEVDDVVMRRDEGGLDGERSCYAMDLRGSSHGRSFGGNVCWEEKRPMRIMGAGRPMGAFMTFDNPAPALRPTPDRKTQTHAIALAIDR
eukprot:scaffold9742_cov66-Skeletonema_marinoi.AAC.1